MKARASPPPSLAARPAVPRTTLLDPAQRPSSACAWGSRPSVVVPRLIPADGLVKRAPGALDGTSGVMQHTLVGCSPGHGKTPGAQNCCVEPTGFVRQQPDSTR